MEGKETLILSHPNTGEDVEEGVGGTWNQQPRYVCVLWGLNLRLPSVREDAPTNWATSCQPGVGFRIFIRGLPFSQKFCPWAEVYFTFYLLCFIHFFSLSSRGMLSEQFTVIMSLSITIHLRALFIPDLKYKQSWFHQTFVDLDLSSHFIYNGASFFFELRPFNNLR